jgi:hypothetical protein
MPTASSLLRRGTPATARGRAEGLTSPPLERALLRRSVGASEAGHDRCVHCHRTPLTGEMVYVYEGAGAERLVCELCRPLRREPPARSGLMLASDHERSVTVRRR